jgi:hypothetical protein
MLCRAVTNKALQPTLTSSLRYGAGSAELRRWTFD